jgi:hypothetical protein
MFAVSRVIDLGRKRCLLSFNWHATAVKRYRVEVLRTSWALLSLPAMNRWWGSTSLKRARLESRAAAAIFFEVLRAHLSTPSRIAGQHDHVLNVGQRGQQCIAIACKYL